MKKIILTIISLFLISFSLVSCTKGNDEVVISLEYKDNGDGTSTVIGIGNYFSEDLVIPEKDNNGNIVTAIENMAFYNKKEPIYMYYKMRSLFIPKTVEKIGNGAFENNYYLKKVTILNPKVEISSFAFANCNIYSLTLSQNSKYDFYAFHYLNRSSYVDELYFFGDNVYDDINKYLFNNLCIFAGVIHTSLDEESIIDDSNKDIVSCKINDKYYLIYYNTNHKNDVILPDSINYKNKVITNYNIGNNLFMYENYWMTSVTIPNSVEMIGSFAFYDCAKIENIELPNNLRVISDYAFYNCKKLTNVDLPSTLESIGAGAFEECESLESIEIPSNVLEIKSGAFENCVNLKKANIYANIDYISKNLFKNCIKLENVVLPNKLKVISYYAFYNCEKLASVSFYSTLESIRKGAFYNCQNLESIEIPSSVVEIEESAFEKCVNLRNANIYANIGYISKDLFRGCISLENVVLPNSLEFIESGAFYGCAIREFHVGSHVILIDKSVFQSEKLKRVYISKSVKTIDDSFYKCENLTELEYEGTMEEWKEIELDLTNSYITRIICSDGIIEQ